MLAAQKDRAGVHAVGEAVGGIAANDKTPFCIMNPAIGPTLPATISIPPFIAMPARVEASPRTTTVPARIEAATALPALPSITMVPSRMLSPAPQPAPPWTMTVAPSFRPAT